MFMQRRMLCVPRGKTKIYLNQPTKCGTSTQNFDMINNGRVIKFTYM